MTKNERLEEIEERRQREHDLILKAQERENNRLLKMKTEKNQEHKEEINRLLFNKNL